MRHPSLPVIVAALVLAGLPPAAGRVFAQAAPAFEAAGTDAAQAAAFLRTLQSAVAVGNCLKVATLVEFPMKAWVDGEAVTIQNESEFQAKYRQVFTPELKKSIAGARPDTLVADQQGVALDNGRVLLRPVGSGKNTLRIVAINEPVQPR